MLQSQGYTAHTQLLSMTGDHQVKQQDFAHKLLHVKLPWRGQVRSLRHLQLDDNNLTGMYDAIVCNDVCIWKPGSLYLESCQIMCADCNQ